MSKQLTEKEYRRQLDKLYDSKASTYYLDKQIDDKKPIIATEAYKEARLLLKLAKEKLNQHNGILERKETALKRNGFK